MTIRGFVKRRSESKTFIGRIFSLADKYWMLITYMIFGGLTTVIDWSVRYFLYKTPLNYHIAGVIGWTAAVLFAFVTNRTFVFQSRRSGFVPVMAELGTFAAGRLLSLAVQEAIMHVCVSILGWDKTVVMIPVSVIVVVINYFFGKILFDKSNKK